MCWISGCSAGGAVSYFVSPGELLYDVGLFCGAEKEVSIAVPGVGLLMLRAITVEVFRYTIVLAVAEAQPRPAEKRPFAVAEAKPQPAEKWAAEELGRERAGEKLPFAAAWPVPFAG